MNQFPRTFVGLVVDLYDVYICGTVRVCCCAL